MVGGVVLIFLVINLLVTLVAPRLTDVRLLVSFSYCFGFFLRKTNAAAAPTTDPVIATPVTILSVLSSLLSNTSEILIDSLLVLLLASAALLETLTPIVPFVPAIPLTPAFKPEVGVVKLPLIIPTGTLAVVVLEPKGIPLFIVALGDLVLLATFLAFDVSILTFLEAWAGVIACLIVVVVFFIVVDFLDVVLFSLLLPLSPP